MQRDELLDKFKEQTFDNGVFNPKKASRADSLLESFDFGDFKTRKEKIYSLLHNITTRPKCVVCGNFTTLKSTSLGFLKFCSKKCSGACKETLDTRKKTTLARYGVSNVGQDKKVLEKIRATNVDRFGVPCSFGNAEVKQKVKDQVMLRYGVDNVMHSPNIVDTVKATWGKKTAEELDKINSKKISRSMLNYGVPHPQQDKNVRKQSMNTCLAKYGATTVWHTAKAKATRHEKYVAAILPQRLKVLEQIKIFPDGWVAEDYTNNSKKYKFKHTTCGTSFSASFANGGVPVCPKCKFGRSSVELLLAERLKDHFQNIKEGDRTQIKPFEIDILIGDVGIEVNGTYWHRDGIGVPLKQKTEMFSGTLIHLWDFEILNNLDLCVSMIRSKLGSFDKRVYARNLRLQKISVAESKVFFEKNHLQGAARASEVFALLDSDGDVIQAMSIAKPRFSRGIDLEVIRLATKQNTQVVGGTSRLLTAVKTEHSGKSLLTYADLRYSTTAAYDKWFKLSHISKPNYLWVKGTTKYSRYETQRSKLSKLFGHITPEDTEASVMTRHGFHRISDCGNAVFVTTL